MQKLTVAMMHTVYANKHTLAICVSKILLFDDNTKDTK